MPTIRGMVRKLRDFLKDETATTAIEYGLVAAGLAVVMMTAIRPANPSPACPTCGLPMRLVTRIPKFSLHPELRAHKCRKCEKTAMEEWEPGKRGSISQRFLAAPILLCLALNRRPDRIVDLAPMVDTAGPIGRGSPFRNDTACGVRDFFAWLAKDVIRRCRVVIKICPHACHRGLQRAVAAVAFYSSIIMRLSMDAYRNLFMAITFPIRLAARILIAVLPQA